MDSRQHEALTPPAEVRVSALVADRACSRCAFNLIGQTIVREPRYDLLIVRCPECGTVAALHEYPLLGRWANRWAAMAAGLWFLVLTAATIGISAIIFGFTVGTHHLTSQTVAQRIATAYESHLRATNPQSQTTGWWNIDQQWWATFDKATLTADGIMRAMDWRGFAIWIVAFLVLVPLSCVWSVLLAHRRGPSLLATYLTMPAIAAIFMGLSRVGTQWSPNASDLAINEVMPVVLPLCLAFSMIPLAVGALIGRPLARLLLTLWLPPRLRVPLSFLWLCDGKTPPKPTW